MTVPRFFLILHAKRQLYGDILVNWASSDITALGDFHKGMSLTFGWRARYHTVSGWPTWKMDFIIIYAVPKCILRGSDCKTARNDQKLINFKKLRVCAFTLNVGSVLKFSFRNRGKFWKSSVGILDVWAEIRTGHIPNTCEKSWASLLGNCRTYVVDI